MKANKLLLATVLFASLTSLSFAGPGIDYWNRMTEAAKNRAAGKAEATAPAQTTKPEAAVAAACTACSGCKSMKKS